MYALIAILLLLLIGVIIYSVSKIHNIPFIKSIKNERISWILACTPIFFFTIFISIDSINTIIVFLYVILFLLLGDFASFLIRKFTKKKIDYTIKFATSIILAILYLGNAYYLAHHVMETRYVVETAKDIGTENFRIAQISDSHVGATMDGDKFIEYMDKINNTNPDIVVVTGDFIDDDTSLEDMKKACEGLGKLKTQYGVYYVYGNHDKGYFDYRGYGDDELREELEKNDVVILEDESILVTDNIYLLGRQDRSELNRASIQDLTKDLDKEKYIIALDYQPNDYDNEKTAGIDLVLSGHSHGGQFFPLGPLGVLFGFNDAYYGLERRENTTFIVNSGIGDWAINFKTGTISEYGIIDIKKKNKSKDLFFFFII